MTLDFRYKIFALQGSNIANTVTRKEPVRSGDICQLFTEVLRARRSSA